jgi:hypothetical protein
MLGCGTRGGINNTLKAPFGGPPEASRFAGGVLTIRNSISPISVVLNRNLVSIYSGVFDVDIPYVSGYTSLPCLQDSVTHPTMPGPEGYAAVGDLNIKENSDDDDDSGKTSRSD